MKTYDIKNARKELHKQRNQTAVMSLYSYYLQVLQHRYIFS